jgi:TBC1 domain family member 2
LARNSIGSASQLQIKTYRENQFEKVLNADVINMAELRKLAWNGIPCAYRAQVWKILLGYLPTNAARRQQTLQRKRAEYRDAIAQHYDMDDDARTVQEQETLRQVLVDVPRTQPEIPLFRNDRVKRVLSRLLYIWAMRHPASSYVQGINDLATPLLTVFLADYFDGNPVTVLDGHIMNHFPDDRLHELEADVYWCLTNLLAGIQDHYTADQPGVQRMVARLEELVHRIDGDLTRHIRDDTGIQFLQFSFKWMNCLLLREFQLKCVVRLWDTYLSEKDGFEDFHVYVCAAFMCQFSRQLQEMTFDELFGFMQEIPTNDWTDTEIEVLLSQAYVLSTLFKGSDAHLTSNNGMA